MGTELLENIKPFAQKAVPCLDLNDLGFWLVQASMMLPKPHHCSMFCPPFQTHSCQTPPAQAPGFTLLPLLGQTSFVVNPRCTNSSAIDFQQLLTSPGIKWFLDFQSFLPFKESLQNLMILVLLHGILKNFKCEVCHFVPLNKMGLSLFSSFGFFLILQN